MGTGHRDSPKGIINRRVAKTADVFDLDVLAGRIVAVRCPPAKRILDAPRSTCEVERKSRAKPPRILKCDGLARDIVSESRASARLILTNSHSITGIFVDPRCNKTSCITDGYKIARQVIAICG